MVESAITIRGKVRNRSDFRDLEAEGNTLRLAKAIEEEGYSLRKSDYPPLVVYKALSRYYRMTADREGRVPVGEHLEKYERHGPGRQERGVD